MRKIISAFCILVIMLMSSISVHAVDANNVQVVSNGSTTFMVESNGKVKGWGRNTKGEVGNGNIIDGYTPVEIPRLSNIKEIIPNDYGYGYFFAIDNSGQVYAWGYNGYGQLGLGHTNNQLTPAKIENLPKISKMVLNEYTTYALTPNGEVYSWGRNNYGQVGNNTKTNQLVTYKIEELPKVTDIICRVGVTFALTAEKEVYAWGRGNDFQMGNGKVIHAQTKPIKISSLSNVDEIITNGMTSFVICDNRQEVYSWGEGWAGELGNLSERNTVPKRIWVLSDLNETIDELIIEQSTAFAITSDNTLYGWGQNGSNQLGNGGTFNGGTPKPINNIPKVRQFIFNGYSGIVLGNDSYVYTWGKNQYGEVGSGDKYRRRYAEKLTFSSNIVQIFDGNNAMYAKDSEGNMYGWGTNTLGQVAIGSTNSLVTPTVIPKLTDIVDILRINNTIIASDVDGVIYGWGNNDYGQLGNNSTETVNIPIVIQDNKTKTTTGTGDVNSTVPIVGSINPLKISITHPINISYSIDPNNKNGFYCPDIHIQNNSKVPVKICLESFKASDEGDLVFEDVLPDDIDWNNLNREETKRYISLGLKYVDETGWLIAQPEMLEPLYAIEVDNTYIGALEKCSGGTLRLCGKHGLAFDGNYTSRHELIFMVSIY